MLLIGKVINPFSIPTVHVSHTHFQVQTVKGNTAVTNSAPVLFPYPYLNFLKGVGCWHSQLTSVWSTGTTMTKSHQEQIKASNFRKAFPTPTRNPFTFLLHTKKMLILIKVEEKAKRKGAEKLKRQTQRKVTNPRGGGKGRENRAGWEDSVRAKSGNHFKGCEQGSGSTEPEPTETRKD